MPKPSNGLETKLAILSLQKDVVYMRDKLDELSEKLDEKYVTQDEFKAKLEPMSKIVYGLVAVILTTVVGALVSVVINK
jgi:hypothetical protein